MSDFVTVDLVPLATALGAGLVCALLGNLLVLRRATLFADALGHSVLPGLVLGYLVAGALSPTAMLLGGVAAGLATAVAVNWLEHTGRLETSAALAAVLSTFFALGVVLIETQGLAGVQLSAESVLSGHLATLVWFPPETGGALALWSSLPSATRTVALTALVVVPLVVALEKELVAAAFDPAFAGASGLRPKLLDLVLYAAVAAAAVAAFEALGSILVVALFTCPPAAARRLTSGVRAQVASSLVLAAAAVLLGYALASGGPRLFGAEIALSPAGSIAVVAAVGLVVVAGLRPRPR